METKEEERNWGRGQRRKKWKDKRSRKGTENRERRRERGSRGEKRINHNGKEKEEEG